MQVGGDENATRPGIPEREERLWAMAAHVAPVVLSAASMGLIGFLAPVLILFLPGERSAFVRDQARESLNFRLTTLIAYVVATPVTIGLVLTGVGICLAVPIWLTLFLVELVLTIIAGVRSYEGERYRYPIAIRFFNG